MGNLAILLADLLGTVAAEDFATENTLQALVTELQSVGDSTSVTMFDAQTTAGNSEVVDVTNYHVASLQVEGVIDGASINVQTSLDGTTFYGVGVLNVSTPGGGYSTSIGMQGVFQADVSALTRLRLEITSPGASTSITVKAVLLSNARTGAAVVNVSDNANRELGKVQPSGSLLAEQLTEADAVANVLTFAATISAIEIYHEEDTWQTFTVNGLSLEIPAGGWSRSVGGVASAEVTIPEGIDCIVGRLT